MNTQLFQINDNHIEEKLIEEAGCLLQQGRIVAFPTETVYGLGANALDEKAASRIYEAKGRPCDNPLIVHIADMKALPYIAEEIPEEALLLAEAFWPGPLTMILKKTKMVPYQTTGGLETVGIRMPDHPVALELIRRGGGYIAAPSANTSGRPSPTCASHVIEDLEGKVDAVIDGGEVGIGLESTIVDLSEGIPTILRPGAVNQEMMEAIIGKVLVDPAIQSTDMKSRPKAPGMKYKHYAPKADLYVVEGSTDAVVDEINKLAGRKIEEGYNVGIIGTDDTVIFYKYGIIKSIGSRTKEETIAKHLYGILREFDEFNVDCIYSEAFETPRLGQAIMNRLLKAAGHQVISV
jgi:L-threonylcarbamoyladenylate synthase